MKACGTQRLPTSRYSSTAHRYLRHWGLHIKLPAERLSLLQWTGILLAFSGIAVTFLGRETATDNAIADMIIGDMYGLMAGFCWGMTTVLIRCSTLSSTPASQTLMYQLLVCFVLLLGATLYLRPDRYPVE